MTDIETLPPVLMSRKTVVDRMYAMSQVKWKVTKPSKFRETDCTFDVQTDRTYTGFYYSHAFGSLEAFEDATVRISDGIHSMSDEYALYIEDTEKTFNVPGDAIILGHTLGCDCSSSIATAWRAVSPNACFDRTKSLVPTKENCLKYGLVPLATFDYINDYFTSWDVNFEQNSQLDKEKRNYFYRSIVSNDDGSINEKKLNDLYEGYALCKPGDAIVYYCKGYVTPLGAYRGGVGHVRLVSQDAHVVRNADGKIDPKSSYLTTIEQGKGNANKINSHNGDTYSSWGVNCRYTFQELAGIEIKPEDKHYAVYVPITNPEYQKTYRDATYFKLVNSTTPYSGIVSSNYGIVYTEVTIDGVKDRRFAGRYGFDVGNDGASYAVYDGMDESGTTSYEELNQNATGSFAANRFLYHSVNLAKHAAAFSSLAAGKHSYSITVKLTTGESKSFFGSFVK